MPSSPPVRVAVVGGGITGLAAAHRVRELAPQCELTLFESSARLGGVLHSECRDGYLLEHSADNFITNVPWALELCGRLGLGNELLTTDERRRRAMVVRRGRLYPVPDGFALLQPARMWPILTSPLLSLAGKLRLMQEAFIPPRRPTGPDDDESLAAFAIRRLGRETFDRLVQPLVGGIYTADAAQLSLAATLPRFMQMEQKHGSLIRAAFATRGSAAAEQQASGARYSLFVAPRQGIQSLVDALAARLPAGSVCCNTAVRRIVPAAQQWRIETQSDAQAFDRVIVALPAPQAAAVVADVSSELAAELLTIPYAGASIALVGYRRDQISNPLDSFGFVVPEVEHRRILAVSFSSNKFPHRAPEGRVLMRVFFGGALHPEIAELSDAALRQIVVEELGELLHARGEPELFQVCRWQRAMPQYHVGHVSRVRRIMALAAVFPGLALAGNAYHGVGVPQCVHSGEQAAEKVLDPANG